MKYNGVKDKIVSSIIVFSVICSSCIYFASCTMKKENNIKSGIIDNKDPWFESENITYGDFTEDDYLVPCLIDNEYRVYFHRFIDNSGEENCVLEVFEKKNGNQHKIRFEEELFGLPVVYNQMIPFRSEYGLSVSVKYGGVGSELIAIYDIDLASNEMYSKKTIAVEQAYSGMYFDKVIQHNDRYYALFSYLDGDYYHYGFKVFDNNWELLYEQTTKGQIDKWSVDTEGRIIAFERNDGIEHVVSIDVDEGRTKNTQLDNSKIIKYQNGVFMNDGRIYIQNTDLTITCFDFNTNTEFVAIDYNCCNANISQLANYILFYADNDNFCFVKSTFYYGELRINNSVVDVIRVSDNPHKGKTILYAATSGSLDSMEGEGIKAYNNNNDSFFIKVTMDYSMSNTEKSKNYPSISDYWKHYYESNNKLIDALLQDIKNDTGPDILLDFGQYSILNSDDLLFDISNVTERINRDEYFANIFDAYRINKKTYHIPLTATVSGIYINSTILTDEKHGVSFNTYNEYVNDVCNGVDPIGVRLGRYNYLSILLKYHYNDLHDDSCHLSINNDEFRLICEQAKASPESMSDISSDANYVCLSFFAYDLSTMTLKEKSGTLLGYPSTIEKGPMVECSQSVAIARCTNHIDAAEDFINVLLSYETQVKNVSSNPVNKQAFEVIAKDILCYVNNKIEKETNKQDYYSTDIIGEYENYLLSANVGGLIDTYTMVIINEEIQAYFKEQKDIDDIIPIVESRVNNMLEERL